MAHIGLEGELIEDILRQLGEDPTLVSRFILDFKFDEPIKVYIERYVEFETLKITLPEPSDFIKIEAGQTK